MGQSFSDDSKAHHILQTHAADVIRHDAPLTTLTLTPPRTQRTLYLHIDKTLSRRLRQYDDALVKQHIHDTTKYSALRITISVTSGTIHSLQWDVNSHFIHTDRHNTTHVLHTQNNGNTIVLTFTGQHTHSWKSAIYKLTICCTESTHIETAFTVKVRSTLSPADTTELQAQRATDQQYIAELQAQLSEQSATVDVLQREIAELSANASLTADAKHGIEQRYRHELDALRSTYKQQLDKQHQQHNDHIDDLKQQHTDNTSHLSNQAQQLLVGVNEQKRARAELLIGKYRRECLIPVYKEWRAQAHRQKQHKMLVLHKYAHRLLHSQLYSCFRQWHGYAQIVDTVNAHNAVQQKFDKLSSKVGDKLSGLTTEKQLLQQQLVDLRDKHSAHVAQSQSVRTQTALFLKWRHTTELNKQRKMALLRRVVTHLEQLPKWNVWRKWRQHAQHTQPAAHLERSAASKLLELQVQTKTQQIQLTDAQHAAYEYKLKYATVYKQYTAASELLNVLLPVFAAFQVNVSPVIKGTLRPFCERNCDCSECLRKAKATFAIVTKLVKTCERNENLRQALSNHAAIQQETKIDQTARPTNGATRRPLSATTNTQRPRSTERRGRGQSSTLKNNFFEV